jgi:ribose/xylose/arabinose/galactoside ABC-type transport system permease subunit
VKRLWQAREVSTVVILLAEVLFFTWYLRPPDGRPHPFFNLGNALLVLKYSSIYGIAAIGAAIVIISGGIDLSPGAVIALTGVVVGALFVETHWSLAASAAAALLVGAACGLANAVLIVLVRLPPFIATLGVMGIARGAAFIITEGRYFDVSRDLPPDWRLLGVPLEWTSTIVMIILALVFHLLMTRFQWGRAVFALGGNPTAALYSGVRVGFVQASVYLIAAVLAALSGITLAVVQGQGKADLAMGYELDIIASAVVGGAMISSS